jgi:hypothetical protein
VEVRLPGILFFLGSFLLLLGERILGGEDPLRYGLSGAGLLVVLAGIGAAVGKMNAAAPDQRPAHRQSLVYGALGIASFAVYGLSLDVVVDGIGFGDDEAEARYRVVIGALWPILWSAAALGLLAVERALAESPTLVMPARVREAGVGGLGAALAIAMLFPLNYLGAELNKRWDFGYFRTARPGTSTKAVVDGLDEPVDVYLFFPTASDVTDELKTYFGELENTRFRVHYVDHALEPELAKDLQVRDNGTIVFSRGEGEDRQLQKVNIGKDFDSAKRKLRKLDEEVRDGLFRAVREKRTVYFTVGHGEMFWDSDTDAERKIANLKKILTGLNFKVKELGLAEGLANAVPDDATAVVVAAPASALDEAELSSLNSYRAKGGSLLVLLEPGAADMSALLQPIGMAFDGSVTLASDTNFLPRTRGPADRGNIITNKYLTHPSVTTLSRNSREAIEVFLGAGALTEEGAVAAGAKRTVTTRSLAEVWGDKDGDYTFDADAEKRQAWTLAMAASGPVADAPPPEEGKTAPEYRVVVVADSTWASDVAMVPERLPANYQAAIDIFAWLAEDDAMAGTVNSEEDVKIEHSKEGQGWIFYGTAFITPLSLLGLGMARIVLRRKKGGSR